MTFILDRSSDLSVVEVVGRNRCYALHSINLDVAPLVQACLLLGDCSWRLLRRNGNTLHAELSADFVEAEHSLLSKLQPQFKALDLLDDYRHWDSEQDGTGC